MYTSWCAVGNGKLLDCGWSQRWASNNKVRKVRSSLVVKSLARRTWAFLFCRATEVGRKSYCGRNRGRPRSIPWDSLERATRGFPIEGLHGDFHALEGPPNLQAARCSDSWCGAGCGVWGAVGRKEGEGGVFGLLCWVGPADLEGLLSCTPNLRRLFGVSSGFHRSQ